MIQTNPTRLLHPHRYLTDGGMETTLIYHRNMPLRDFATFELLRSARGRQALTDYYLPYLELAAQRGYGFVLESPTWRANTDWGYRLSYTPGELGALNKQSIGFLRELARPYADSLPHLLINGTIGPRGDGYTPDMRMTADQARAYHQDQVRDFALADADAVTALTLAYPEEAIGILLAARTVGLPAVISFTVETNGHLPGGETLAEAIRQVDTATDRYAAYFMINCAHPRHFAHHLHADDPWVRRIRGIRANASTHSHVEMRLASTLDSGDKHALAAGYLDLCQRLPDLQVLGGCCGTDHTHLEAICQAVPEHTAWSF